MAILPHMELCCQEQSTLFLIAIISTTIQQRMSEVLSCVTPGQSFNNLNVVITNVYKYTNEVLHIDPFFATCLCIHTERKIIIYQKQSWKAKRVVFARKTCLPSCKYTVPGLHRVCVRTLHLIPSLSLRQTRSKTNSTSLRRRN